MKGIVKTRIIILLILSISFVTISNGDVLITNAADSTCSEIVKDDGSAEFGFMAGKDGIGAVRFHSDETTIVSKLKFYTWGDMITVKACILDSSQQVMFSRQVMPTPGWYELDVASEGIIVSGDFYVAWMWITEGIPGSWLGVDKTGTPHYRSYLGSVGSLNLVKDVPEDSGVRQENYMIRVEICPTGQEPPSPIQSGTLQHFDLDFKGSSNPAEGVGDGNDQHSIEGVQGTHLSLYFFYSESNTGNNYIIRVYPEWDKNNYIANSDNDEGLSEIGQEIGGRRYDIESYQLPSDPGTYKIRAVYNASNTPPRWDNYEALLSEFTVNVVLSIPAHDDHGNSASTATEITAGTSVPGSIETEGDIDFFRFSTHAGFQYTIDTTLSSLNDSYIHLYNKDGTTELDYDDDNGPGLASHIVWTAPSSGDYYIKVRAYNNHQVGTYTIIITTTSQAQTVLFQERHYYAQGTFDEYAEVTVISSEYLAAGKNIDLTISIEAVSPSGAVLPFSIREGIILLAVPEEAVVYYENITIEYWGNGQWMKYSWDSSEEESFWGSVLGFILGLFPPVGIALGIGGIVESIPSGEQDLSLDEFYKPNDFDTIYIPWKLSATNLEGFSKLRIIVPLHCGDVSVGRASFFIKYEQMLGQYIPGTNPYEYDTESRLW